MLRLLEDRADPRQQLARAPADRLRVEPPGLPPASASVARTSPANGGSRPPSVSASVDLPDAVRPGEGQRLRPPRSTRRADRVSGRGERIVRRRGRASATRCVEQSRALGAVPARRAIRGSWPGTQTPARRERPRPVRRAPARGRRRRGRRRRRPARRRGRRGRASRDAVLDDDQRSRRCARATARPRRAPPATPSGSRFAVGSSSSSSPGRIARAPASASRCFCPPESGIGRVVERQRRARPRRAPRARASTARSRGTPRFSQPNATSSPTRDMITCESGSCSTRPAAPARRARVAPVDRELAVAVALVIAAEHAGQRGQQRRLARAGRRRAAEPAPPARWRDRGRAAPRPAAGVPPAPAAGATPTARRPRSAIRSRLRTSPQTAGRCRPEANRFSAPVGARARDDQPEPSTPARTAPEIAKHVR